MSAKADKILEQFGGNISRAVAQRPGQPAMPPETGPDRYAGATRSRMFAEMPVTAIIADVQPRTEFDAEDLERLASSIRRFGQLAPIRVRRDESRGAWVVLVGERRLRACKLAGLEKVRVEFVEREMTEADVLAEQVVENAVRADLQPVEAGRAYKRLMELNGWTAQQLAESIGVEATAVYRSLALLKLPDDVAAKVDAGEIKATAAYEISKLQIADDQRALAERVVSEGLDHKTTAAEVARRKVAPRGTKGRGATKARPTKERVIRTSIGKATLELRKAGDAEQLLALVREVAVILEAELEVQGQAAA